MYNTSMYVKMKGEVIPGVQGRQSTLLGRSPHPQEDASSSIPRHAPQDVTPLSKSQTKDPLTSYRSGISPPPFLTTEVNEMSPSNCVSTHSYILPVTTVVQL